MVISYQTARPPSRDLRVHPLISRSKLQVLVNVKLPWTNNREKRLFVLSTTQEMLPWNVSNVSGLRANPKMAPVCAAIHTSVPQHQPILSLLVRQSIEIWAQFACKLRMVFTTSSVHIVSQEAGLSVMKGVCTPTIHPCFLSFELEVDAIAFGFCACVSFTPACC